MHYTIQQIATITGGQLLAPREGEAPVEHLLLDSRQVIFPETSLFIALKGRRHDGHDYLQELQQVGVRNFIISQAPQEPNPEANFVLVPDTQEAFHRLATFHRRQFQLPVIAITGSNGKTIVKEWLFQLLQEDYHIVRSPKSFNSQTGVPLSVLQINPEHTLGIFEAGISKMGEMERLEPILHPNIGIFTTIGPAHSEGFPDLETKLREKLQLFANADTVIYCADNPLIAAEMQSLGRPRYLTWSVAGHPADLQITAIHSEGNQTRIEAGPQQIVIPFTDAASGAATTMPSPAA